MRRMVFRAVRSWTLGDLIVAFIELGVAYTLLCGSAFAFVPSKILSLFGVYLPCPCNGFFGYQNYDLCFHRLLVDWPRRKIIIIQELAKSRFPFDLIWFEHQSCDFHVERFGVWKQAHQTSEFDGEACSSSVSGPTWQRSVENKVVNQKQKSGRRRKRAALGYGKLSSLYSDSTSTHTFGTGVPQPLYDSLGMRSKFGESFDPGRSRKGDKSQGDTNTPSSSDFGESIKHSFELDGSYRKGEDMYKGSCPVEKFTCNAEECKHCSVGSDANVIQMLEQALEEEKTARAALYQELEQERAAAATAADEAMAMILRLQEDKASIEMEARQYHRVMEEKFVYDEEEMKILKEILVRREREIHFLEKEVEAYEQMNLSANDPEEGDLSSTVNDNEQRTSLSADLNVNLQPMTWQVENRKFIGEKGDGTSGQWPSDYDHRHILAVEKETTSMELASESSISQASVQKTVTVLGKEETDRDICMISPEVKAPEACGAIIEQLEKNGEHLNQAGCYLHNSTLDAESTVYDVHVIDDTANVQNSNLFSNCPTTSTSETDSAVHGSNFDVHRELQGSGNSQFKTVNIDSQRHSPSLADGERLKIDNEVEWLRERLRVVQEEKEKLTFSAEHRERLYAQLKLVEDVVNRLREIQ